MDNPESFEMTPEEQVQEYVLNGGSIPADSIKELTSRENVLGLQKVLANLISMPEYQSQIKFGGEQNETALRFKALGEIAVDKREQHGDGIIPLAH